MSARLAQWLGRPWRAGACGPDAFDCRGLVASVQRELWGRALPPLVGDMRAVRDDCTARGWAPTDDAPQPGDVLLVHAIDGPHVGVFVQSGRRVLVLHARSQTQRGVESGRVELRALPDLLHAGYVRPQVWRCAA